MSVLNAGDGVAPVSGDGRTYGVISSTRLTEGDATSSPKWLVLCVNPHNPFHKYGVWNAYYRDGEGWSFMTGDYYNDIADAVESYKKRGGASTQTVYDALIGNPK